MIDYKICETMAGKMSHHFTINKKTLYLDKD